MTLLPDGDWIVRKPVLARIGNSGQRHNRKFGLRQKWMSVLAEFGSLNKSHTENEIDNSQGAIAS